MHGQRGSSLVAVLMIVMLIAAGLTVRLKHDRLQKAPVSLLARQNTFDTIRVNLKSNVDCASTLAPVGGLSSCVPGTPIQLLSVTGRVIVDVPHSASGKFHLAARCHPDRGISVSAVRFRPEVVPTVLPGGGYANSADDYVRDDILGIPWDAKHPKSEFMGAQEEPGSGLCGVVESHPVPTGTPKDCRFLDVQLSAQGCSGAPGASCTATGYPYWSHYVNIACPAEHPTAVSVIFKRGCGNAYTSEEFLMNSQGHSYGGRCLTNVMGHWRENHHNQWDRDYAQARFTKCVEGGRSEAGECQVVCCRY